MSTRRFMFIHGGPGFNSRPEQGLLDQSLSKLQFQGVYWNEPSVLRPNGDSFFQENPFLNQVNSLKSWGNKYSPDILICHSYGMYPALAAIQRGFLKPSRLVLISPVFNLNESHRRILRLAAGDFARTSPVESQKLLDVLKLKTELFDTNMQIGMLSASTDPELLSHYWVNKESMNKALGFFNGEFQFDGQSFFSVLTDLRNYQREFVWDQIQLDIPTLIYFGNADPIAIQSQDEIYGKKAFRELTTLSIEGGHWPHIESSENFTGTLSSWCKDKRSS